jgi:hypothetical protein
LATTSSGRALLHSLPEGIERIRALSITRFAMGAVLPVREYQFDIARSERSGLSSVVVFGINDQSICSLPPRLCLSAVTGSAPDLSLTITCQRAEGDASPSNLLFFPYSLRLRRFRRLPPAPYLTQSPALRQGVVPSNPASLFRLFRWSRPPRRRRCVPSGAHNLSSSGGAGQGVVFSGPAADLTAPPWDRPDPQPALPLSGKPLR